MKNVDGDGGWYACGDCGKFTCTNNPTKDLCVACGSTDEPVWYPDTYVNHDEPVTIEDRRAMGDDMLYPTYNIFGEWEN